MNLLHVDSSITGADSVSRALSGAIVDRLKHGAPGPVTVVRRDLAATPLRYFEFGDAGGVASGPAGERSPAPLAPEPRPERRALDEFMAADTVVVGAPMYNFGVPAQLKTWIDWLAIAGVTFRYTEAGPVGLAGGKRVIIASSRGGYYGPGSPAAALDHQEAYLQGVFGFLGITDITVIRAEGVKVSADERERALAAALAEADALTSAPPATIANVA